MTSLHRGTRLAPTSALHAGVDENGLGPLLGPLLVTGALARVLGATAPLREEALVDAFATLAARAGDSKALVDFHDSALGEAWARALLARDGNAPETPAALFEALLHEPREVREGRCPSAAARARCFDDGRPFDATDAQVAQAGKDLELLERSGVTVLAFRAHSVCVAMLNDAFRSGISRFSVDLRGMEALLLAFHQQHREPMIAICGKVGGYEKYDPQFHHLAKIARTTVREGRAESRYEFAGMAPGEPALGTVAFVRDADATAPLVGLASLVGKYLRDRMMRTIALHHLPAASAFDPAIVAAPSGYHDPVTKRFVAATALARSEATDLPDDCFLRAGKDDAEKKRAAPEPKNSTKSQTAKRGAKTFSDPTLRRDETTKSPLLPLFEASKTTKT